MSQAHAAGKRTRTAIVGGVLAGTVVLGGCTQSPSTVATVDGDTITKSDLQSAYDGARQVSNQITKDQTVSVLIQGTVANQVAERRHLTITHEQREKELNPQMLKQPAARDFALHLADVQIVGKKIGDKELAKQVAHADVTLNPRYGSWNPKKSVNVLPDSGSLSKKSQQSEDQTEQSGQTGPAGR